MLTDEVVIADVQLVQGPPEGGDDAGVVVAQVEDATVAVAVNEALLPADVPDVDAFSPAKDEIQPHASEELRLPAGHVAGEAGDDLLFSGLTDEGHG